MGTRRRSRGLRASTATCCALLALAVAGCAGESEPTTDPGADSPSSDSTPSGSPSGAASATSEPAEPEMTVIDVRVRGDEVEPRGARVQVAAGEPFAFAIDSDAPGEIHVHATPEAEIAFDAGRSRKRLTLDRPGIVEVELHEPTEVTVAQLEVR